MRWGGRAPGPSVLCTRLGAGGGGLFCLCLPFSKQASLLGASEICRVRRPAPTICLCSGSVLSGWWVWLGAAPVFGEGPLLRRRLSCILTLEQLRSVPSRGTVPIGPQTWLGLGGPGGCRSLLTTPSLFVCSMACGSPTVSLVVLAAGALREDRSALYPYMANHGASPHLLGGPPTNILWRAFWVAPMGAPGRGYVGVPAFHIATNR